MVDEKGLHPIQSFKNYPIHLVRMAVPCGSKIFFGSLCSQHGHSLLLKIVILYSFESMLVVRGLWRDDGERKFEDEKL
jgi:hypothetical protein